MDWASAVRMPAAERGRRRSAVCVGVGVARDERPLVVVLQAAPLPQGLLVHLGADADDRPDAVCPGSSEGRPGSASGAAAAGPFRAARARRARAKRHASGVPTIRSSSRRSAHRVLPELADRARPVLVHFLQRVRISPVSPLKERDARAYWLAPKDQLLLALPLHDGRDRPARPPPAGSPGWPCRSRARRACTARSAVPATCITSPCTGSRPGPCPPSRCGRPTMPGRDGLGRWTCSLGRRSPRRSAPTSRPTSSSGRPGSCACSRR